MTHPAVYGVSTYGEADYGTALNAFGSAAARLQAMIPVAVWGDPASNSWAQVVAYAIGLEVQQAWQAIQWIVQQAYPALADANGLVYWEQLLGLPQNPPNLTTEQRRGVVLSRRHAVGPVQVPTVTALVQQYQPGTPVVTWDAPSATLTVTWTDPLGIPPNQGDVDRALKAYLPAWVLIGYVYTYTTWDEVTATGRTWDQLTADGFTWDQLATTPPGSL